MSKLQKHLTKLEQIEKFQIVAVSDVRAFLAGRKRVQPEGFSYAVSTNDTKGRLERLDTREKRV